MSSEIEIVKKELEEIFDKCAKSQNLKDYTVVLDDNASNGDGLLSDFFIGNIVNENSEETINVAVKKGPKNGLLPDYESIFKNELHFYTKVFPALDKFQKERNVKDPFNNVPKYYAGDSRSGGEFIALENLKSLGYKLFDKTKYFDSDHLELIFKTYGKLHVLSFSLKQNNPELYDELTKLFTSTKDVMSEDMKKDIGRTFFVLNGLFDSIATKHGKFDLRNLKFEDIANYKGKYRCLRHGDCWSNNMLFKYKASGEPTDMKLLDFQMVCDGTPIHDLSYFFYSGASKTDMDKLEYYMEIYYKNFSEFARELGEDAEQLYPYDALKEEWKQYGGLGALVGCHLWVTKLMNREDIIGILGQKELPPDEYAKLWAERFNRIRDGPEFRQKARDICLHAIEYGIFG